MTIITTMLQFIYETTQFLISLIELWDLGSGVNFLVIVPLSRYQSTELQRIFSKLKVASFDKEDRSEAIEEKDYTVVEFDCEDTLSLLARGSEVRSQYRKIIRDKFVSDRVPHYPLELFGMTFYFNPTHERYELSEKYYDFKELIFIIEDFFREMHSINSKGFVVDSALSQRFMVVIMDNLVKLGFRRRELGNNETTYTM